MSGCIGIRREDKNRWEARAPLTPDQVAALVEGGIEVKIQPSDIRGFADKDYMAAGAEVVEDISNCKVVLAVKEIPADFFLPGRAYVFFSHTIKGQKENMPMLKRLMEAGASLVDYEKITDEKGRRLVFFGRYAGFAGMIDTLWALGRRLQIKGIETPLVEIQQAYHYHGLEAAKQVVSEAGRKLARQGVPRSLRPMVVGFAGYGNVSGGAQEIFDLLPHVQVDPEDLFGLEPIADKLVKVVFHERHMVRPKHENVDFDLQDYYDNPGNYEPRFEEFLNHLSVLVNCIFWTNNYPRLITRKWVESTWASGEAKLEVIGDISCDIEGAVEITTESTDPGDPVYVFDVDKKEACPGFQGRGPVILAVDNLPCELPRDSSQHFGKSLGPFLPYLAGLDPASDLESSGLPGSIKRAVIVWKGELTGAYRYLEKYLAETAGT
ncbi:MAG: hypothetical protein GXP49_10565 [Deltaproteobacteria bacterium]|nr:hypothetical protein [Deltaproteobacteria bacterium]